MLNIFKPLTKATVELCPEVNGMLLLHGRPLSGITINRYLYYDNDVSDSVISNEDGSFKFESALIKSRKPNNPWALSHSVSQAIYVDFKEKRYRLWVFNTPGWKGREFAEEKLNNLICDLGDTEFQSTFSRPDGGAREYLVTSMAKWNNFRKKLNS